MPQKYRNLGKEPSQKDGRWKVDFLQPSNNQTIKQIQTTSNKTNSYLCLPQEKQLVDSKKLG